MRACVSVCIVHTMWIAKQTHTQKKNQCRSPGTGNNSVLLPAACCVSAKQTVLRCWTTVVQRNAWPRLEGKEGQRQKFLPQVKINRVTQLSQHVMLMFTEYSRGEQTQYLHIFWGGEGGGVRSQWCRMNKIKKKRRRRISHRNRTPPWVWALWHRWPAGGQKSQV